MDAASSKLLLWLFSFTRQRESSSSEEDNKRTLQEQCKNLQLKELLSSL